MERYAAYKDSGVEWIGEIPEWWEVKALKRFAAICNGRDHKDVWDINGKYPIIGSGGIFGRASQYLYDKTSVILGRKGTIDKPQFITEPFWSVDTAYFTDIYENTDKKFFYYLCLTINFDLYKYGSAVPSMTQEVLSQIPFCAPPKNEQAAIANYLDRKTAEIDALIAQKQRLIELYQEEKTAIINQAVTKGINPDAKLKDSDIDWLGEIPDGWEVKKLKYVAYFQRGHDLSSTNFQKGEIPVYGSNGIIGYHDEFTVKGPSITVGRSGSVGEVNFVEQAYFWAHNTSLFLHKDYGNNINYLYYLLGCLDLKSYSAGTAVGSLNRNNIHEIIVTIPPTEKQSTIVHYIETETARINAKISKTQRIIELQKEYRTALIFEAVTGKIKVSHLVDKEMAL